MFASVLPKISIITATFNSEKHLEQTIRSVLGQTYSKIEYIIVDGKSIDNTGVIIERYKTKISKVISEPDNGIYDAFNKGIQMASGDIVYFLNSDDYLKSESIIEEVAGIFMNNPDTSIVYGNVLMVDEGSNYQYLAGKKVFLYDLKKGYMCPHQGLFVKKDLFIRHGLFDLKYKVSSDFDFVIKCFKDYARSAFHYNKVIAVFRTSGISCNPMKERLLKEERTEIIRRHFGSSGEENTQGVDITPLYRVWLEKILINKKGISNILHKEDIKNVAVFGTMKNALCLLEDLIMEKINVFCFLDNNENMQGKKIEGIEIFPPIWLAENLHLIDAVLLSIESSRDIEVKRQLMEIVHDKSKPIYSWKDLIRESLS